MNPRIAIVGGGVAGLALSAALHRAGLAAEIYERAPRLDAVGAGLLLTPNATEALARIDALAPLLPHAQINRALHLRDRRGAELSRVPVDDCPTPALSVLRAVLQRELATLLPPDSLRLGRGLTGLRRESGAWRLEFADGTETRADLAVGADGLRSAVRAFFRPGETPAVYRGYMGWRGLVCHPAPEFVDHPAEFWGRGRRFGIAPSGGGVTYWYATGNHPADWSPPREIWKPHLLAAYRDWAPVIRELIEATPADEILLNPIHDRDTASEWTVPGGVLIGDAAHPMTPNLGQGACLALEDAVVLADFIVRHGPAEGPAAFAAHRQARVRRIVQRSRLIGRLIQHDTGPGCAIRDWLVGRTPAAFTRRQFADIFAPKWR